MTIEPLQEERALTLHDEQESTERAPGRGTESDREDAKLLRRIGRERDRAAMRMIYDRYQGRLRGFLRRLTDDQPLIDETYNDVMLSIWEHADGFRAEAKPSSWIFSIAYRQCVRVLKKEQRKRSLLARLWREPTDLATSTNEQFEEAELISAAMQQLNHRQRMVIELSYFEGYSTSEISEIVQCPQGTVKTRLHHARTRIRHVVSRLADPNRLAGRRPA